MSVKTKNITLLLIVLFVESITLSCSPWRKGSTIKGSTIKGSNAHYKKHVRTANSK